MTYFEWLKLRNLLKDTMPLPVDMRPAAFKELIVSESETLCTAQVKAFVKFPFLLYRLVKYMWGNDNKIAETFKADICQALSECTPEPTVAELQEELKEKNEALDECKTGE